MPNLYNLRMAAPGHFAIAKFDPSFNVEAVYNLISKGPGRGYSCDCPASARAVKLRPCKHQRMLPLMLGACNTERFFDPETGAWHEPLKAMRNGDEDGLPMTLSGVAVEIAEEVPSTASSLQPPPVAATAPVVQAKAEQPTPALPSPTPSRPTLTRRI